MRPNLKVIMNTTKTDAQMAGVANTGKVNFGAH
jgi:hypothetical protein